MSWVAGLKAVWGAAPHTVSNFAVEGTKRAGGSFGLP